MAEIGVIVPVYNVENYIERCIDSIIAQTFTDFTLVLVDDGSSDSSGKICNEYAKNDKRIHVIRQMNGGAASARNAGLEWIYNNTKCSWIAFIDSDDWINSRYLEMHYNAVKKLKVKISQCGVFDTNGNEKLPALKGVPARLISSEEANNMKGAVAPTRKLYNRECFQQIRYPEGKLFEDEFVTYRVFFQVKQVAFIDEALYYYYVRPGSLMHSSWNPRYLDALEAYEEQIAFFSKEGIVNSQKRSVMNMMNTIIIQFHEASKIKAYPQIRILRKKMRMLIRNYGKAGYGWITFRKHQGAYEVLHPRIMWIYWVTKSKLNNFSRKG